MKGKLWKQGHVGGGVTNRNIIILINVTMSLLVFSINLIDQISKGQSLIDRWDKTIPFLLVAVFSLLAIKNFKVNAYLYAFISIIVLLTTEQTGDLTGIIFLIFSLYIFKSNILSAIIILCTLILIGTKVFYDFSGNQMLILLFGYIYSILIYYFLIHPKPTPVSAPIVIFCPYLDAKDVLIVEKLYQSYIHKEIAPMVSLSKDAVSRRISRMYIKLDVKSSAELVAKCLHMGYIKGKVDK